MLQIRETPHKRHHKFIEFYDVRAADAALRALNRSDIAGKRIKLEPSRPGGARRWYSPILLLLHLCFEYRIVIIEPTLWMAERAISCLLYREGAYFLS